MFPTLTAFTKLLIAALIALVLVHAPAGVSQAASVNEDAVAVIIGNKTYGGKIPEVSFAHNDADAMRKFVIEALGYREGNVIDLRDATGKQLEAVFGNDKTHKGKLFDWIRPGDSDITVFYSGHGVPGLNDKRAYLLPVDGDANRAEITGFPVDTLYRNLAKLPAKSVRVFIDACFSGETPKGMVISSASGLSVSPKAPKSASQLVTLTAAQGDQLASWDDDAKMGLFTKHLLEALYGAADNKKYGNGDGKVSLAEVGRYLDREMSYQARRRFGRVQKASVTGKSSTVLAPEIIERRIASNVTNRKPKSKPLLPTAGGSAHTVDFEGLDSSKGRVSGADLRAYLDQFGITLTNVVEPLNAVFVEHDSRSQSMLAASGHNYLEQASGGNTWRQFTLTFDRPLDSFSFTRTPYYGATKSGIVYAEWRATAKDANGKVLGVYGEKINAAYNPITKPVPAKRYSFTGGGIASVTIFGDHKGYAGTGSAGIDDLVLKVNAVAGIASPIFHDFPPLIISLSESGYFLKLVLAAELVAKDDRLEIENYAPKIVDGFQTYLRDLKLSDLKGSAGVEKIRSNLLEVARRTVGRGKVKSILVREMIVQ